MEHCRSTVGRKSPHKRKQTGNSSPSRPTCNSILRKRQTHMTLKGLQLRPQCHRASNQFSELWSTFHLPVRGIVRNRWRTSLSLARNSSVVPVASGEAHIPLLSVCSAGNSIACSHTGAFLCSCGFLCLEAPSSLFPPFADSLPL